MELIRQILAVSGVLMLLGGALWWLRRQGFTSAAGARGRRPRTLETIERVPLSPQHSLYLVRMGGRGLLVGASAQGCALLESFDWSSLDPGGHPSAPEVR